MREAEWDFMEDRLLFRHKPVGLCCDGHYVIFAPIKFRALGSLILLALPFDRPKNEVWNHTDCEAYRRFGRRIFKTKFRSPAWFSFKELKAHLINNNSSIELEPEV